MSKVLLTGANGFIGVHILKVLLARGYDVVGTVRSESKTTYLRELFKNSDKLNFAIVEDIAAPGAFDQVIKDNKFDAVLHTSSPFTLKADDVEKDLYKPAIQGTTGILKSVKAFGPTVKRVVVLSSFASVVDGSEGNRPGYTYTDKDWNPVTWEAGIANPAVGYYASKKFAEKAAWDFIEEEKPHFDLTTLCPPMVYGPPEQELSSLSKLNTSSAEIYGYFSGTGQTRNGVWLWVDVRDIALAHALAIESPAAANQRYLITQGRYSAQQFLEGIWKEYPDRAAAKNVPKPAEYFPPEGVYTGDNSKSKKDFGLNYRHDFEGMLVDTLKRFEELEKEIPQ